jgi:hypothetical protein
MGGVKVGWGVWARSFVVVDWLDYKNLVFWRRVGEKKRDGKLELELW